MNFAGLASRSLNSFADTKSKQVCSASICAYCMHVCVYMYTWTHITRASRYVVHLYLYIFLFVICTCEYVHIYMYNDKKSKRVCLFMRLSLLYASVALCVFLYDVCVLVCIHTDKNRKPVCRASLYIFWVYISGSHNMHVCVRARVCVCVCVYVYVYI